MLPITNNNNTKGYLPLQNQINDAPHSNIVPLKNN